MSESSGKPVDPFAKYAKKVETAQSGPSHPDPFAKFAKTAGKTDISPTPSLLEDKTSAFLASAEADVAQGRANLEAATQRASDEQQRRDAEAQKQLKAIDDEHRATIAEVNANLSSTLNGINDDQKKR